MAGDGRPPRRRIADDLREAIRRGEIGEGKPLPSIRILAARYGTARNTAESALKILAAEGLITIRHGARAVVRARPPLLRLGIERYSRQFRQQVGESAFLAGLARQGRDARVEARSVERVRPPVEVAERLASAGDTVRRETWYFADGVPAQIESTYIPWTIAAGTPLATGEAPFATGIQAYLESLGHAVATVREEVTARAATPEEATALQLPAGVPVIDVLHTSLDPDGVPFEVTRLTLRADLVGLDYTVPVE